MFSQITARAGVFVGLNVCFFMHFPQIDLKADSSCLHVVGVVVFSYARINGFVYSFDVPQLGI